MSSLRTTYGLPVIQNCNFRHSGAHIDKFWRISGAPNVLDAYGSHCGKAGKWVSARHIPDEVVAPIAPAATPSGSRPKCKNRPSTPTPGRGLPRLGQRQAAVEDQLLRPQSSGRARRLTTPRLPRARRLMPPLEIWVSWFSPPVIRKPYAQREHWAQLEKLLPLLRCRNST